MFILKLIFILFLVALLIFIGITLYNKFKNPENSIIESMPFLDEFGHMGDHKTSPRTDDETNHLKNTAINDNFETTNSDEKAISTDGVEKASEKANIVKEKVTVVDTIKKPKKVETIQPAAKIDSVASTISTETISKKLKKESPKAKPTSKNKKPTKKGDNIKKVNGIGPVFEKKLNAIGVNSFEHIANWSDEDMAKIDEDLNLAGRPQREEWIAKAKVLLAAKSADV